MIFKGRVGVSAIKLRSLSPICLDKAVPAPGGGGSGRGDSAGRKVQRVAEQQPEDGELHQRPDIGANDDVAYEVVVGSDQGDAEEERDGQTKGAAFWIEAPQGGKERDDDQHVPGRETLPKTIFSRVFARYDEGAAQRTTLARLVVAS